MTSPLPERPNLEQLKTQAKDLLRSARANDPAALARLRALPALASKSDAEIAALRLALHDAQSIVAREYGFASWNALREHVEVQVLAATDALNDFLTCALDERPGRARRMLDSYPEIARASLHAALVLGDAVTVAGHLEKDPALATRVGGPRDWPPLLYVCFTCLQREGLATSDGLVAIARQLLSLGADPNSSFPTEGDPEMRLPALWGATCVARCLPLAEVLLKAGANPNDGESVYHAAEAGDVAALDLLHAHGALADGAPENRWGNTPLYFILGHAVEAGRAEAVRRGAEWLLAHGADPNRVCYRETKAETPLHVAARNWDVPMLELLARHGANLRARRADGHTAFALASLHGHPASAEWLRAHDGGDELTGGERFIAACTRGDQAKAEAMLRGEPALAAVASNPKAIKLFIKMAGRGNIVALRTMLACGFRADVVDDGDATPLHWAALHGQLEAVQLLLAHGASVTARDKSYHAEPLGWTDYGAIHMRHPRGDYAGVARALLAPGAPIRSDAAPPGSDEVLAAIAEFQDRA